MSRKPETTFIASVHKHLAPSVHREKMNNPYRSGTADVWYSGYWADFWIEYKFLPTLPKRAGTEIKLDLSENQKIWLRTRYKEGRNVAVICGCKDGGVIFTDIRWEYPMSVESFTRLILTRTQLANWICAQTGAAPNVVFPDIQASKSSKSDIQNSG